MHVEREFLITAIHQRKDRGFEVLNHLVDRVSLEATSYSRDRYTIRREIRRPKNSGVIGIEGTYVRHLEEHDEI